jgi:outer membrane protein insertion porin family
MRNSLTSKSALAVCVCNTLVSVIVLCLSQGEVSAQSGPRGGAPPADASQSGPKRPNLGVQIGGPANSPPIAGIRVIGNKLIKTREVLASVNSRTGRAFDPDRLQADVRRLMSTKQFRDVRTYTQSTPNGIVVTYEVFELPTIKFIEFIGNRAISDRNLLKQAGLEKGKPLDVYDVNEAVRKIEAHYQSKGLSRTQVAVLEGNSPDDNGVRFAISEDVVQRIWSVNFVGNKLTTGARLKTLIKSKPGYFKYLFRGQLDWKQVDDDVVQLTEYYRNLGYFHAVIGRDLELNRNGSWADLTFYINEGPQYQIRDVRVIGSEVFDPSQLVEQLKLVSNEPYHAGKLQSDTNILRDIYGSQGFIFADVKPETRFHEEPGKLDLVYMIEEGEQYRVGKINIHIAGDNPHTREKVVLNRISLRPGDIIDIRRLRDSERRLKASQLFLNEPFRGVAPKVVVRPPDITTLARRASETSSPAGGRIRGQSPSVYRGPLPYHPSRPQPKQLDLDIYVAPR